MTYENIIQAYTHVYSFTKHAQCKKIASHIYPNINYNKLILLNGDISHSNWKVVANTKRKMKHCHTIKQNLKIRIFKKVTVLKPSRQS